MGLVKYIKRKELDKINRLENSNQIFQDELCSLKDKYKDIISLEDYISQKTSEKFSIEDQIKTLNNKYIQDYKLYKSLMLDLDALKYGCFDIIHNYERPEDYQFKMKEAWEKTCNLSLFIDCNPSLEIFLKNNESINLVYRSHKDFIDLLFNELIDIYSRVKWNNLKQITNRFNKAVRVINNLGKLIGVQLNPKYVDIISELIHIEYDYKLFLQKEKENERRLREEMKEEEKALRDYERAIRDAERDELYYGRALERVKREIEQSTGAKYYALVEKLNYYKSLLEEASSIKERALSMAQQTKRGYVYVISNIGSFGENVYKIGMTRRLDPFERVYELGNASVPFKYDVHAMIFSEDAPALECLLHNSLNGRKLNLVNSRKEFFLTPIENIEKTLKEHEIKTDIIKTPQAYEYRQSLFINGRSEPMKSEYKDTLKENVEDYFNSEDIGL